MNSNKIIVNMNLKELIDLEDGSNIDRRQNEMDKLLTLRKQMRLTLSNVLDHTSTKMINTIGNIKDSLTLTVSEEINLLKYSLQNNVSTFEASLVMSMLQYFYILNQEMEMTQKQLIKERKAKESLKKQAKTLRDLLLFQEHLKLETNSRIEINLLSTESAQFKRCVKAVHDNNNISLSTKNPKIISSDLKVLNVFKLKNVHLTKNLQEAHKRFPMAKLKGLFCCLPSENIYGFSVYGTMEQSLPTESKINFTKDTSIFSPPWLFTDKTPLVPLPDELAQVHSISGAAQKLSCRNIQKPFVRFSKYSSISSLTSYNDQQHEKGVFLALCRVLINKQISIEGIIEDRDIVEASMNGYDAIFSNSNEEYVLLDPSFVVPEFLIHCDFSRIINQSNDDENLPTISNYLLNSINDQFDFHLNDSVTGKKNEVTMEKLLFSNQFQNQQGTDNTKIVVGPQKSIVIKQSALIAIEENVERYRRTKDVLLKDSASRVRSTLSK